MSFFFSYDVTLDLALKKGMILFVMIEDEGDFMNFITDEKKMHFNAPDGYKIIENANYNMVFFDFKMPLSSLISNLNL